MCRGPASNPPTWSAFMSPQRKRSSRTPVCLSWLISAHTVKDSSACSVNIYCKWLHWKHCIKACSGYNRVTMLFFSCAALRSNLLLKSPFFFQWMTNNLSLTALMSQGWRGRVSSVPVSDRWCEGSVWKILQRVQGGLAAMGALHRHRARPPARIGKKLGALHRHAAADARKFGVWSTFYSNKRDEWAGGG